jgi:hypothetical protein
MRTSDFRTFVLLCLILACVTLAALILNVLHGRIPLLGTLPGDFFMVIGSEPLYLPLTTTALVGALLTASASLASFISKDR